MKRKALIVYNPSSGNHASHKILKELIAGLESAGILHVALETKSVDTSDYIYQSIDESTTDVVAIGGDGTLNHVVNGIRNCNTVLNIIPAGTGNDFVKNIDIGHTLEEQIQTVIQGKESRIDVGQCNDRLFLNGVGLGFDGQIVSDMLNKKSWLSGHVKYYSFVLRILATFEPVALNYSTESENIKKEVLLLAIANGTTYGGGFKLAPNAAIADGYLDVCSIGKISPIRRFLNIHKLSSGTHGKLKQVDFHKVNSIQIEENNHIVGHIDGEFLGNPPFDIKILPKFLKLRVRQEV